MEKFYIYFYVDICLFICVYLPKYVLYIYVHIHTQICITFFLFFYSLDTGIIPKCVHETVQHKSKCNLNVFYDCGSHSKRAGLFQPGLCCFFTNNQMELIGIFLVCAQLVIICIQYTIHQHVKIGMSPTQKKFLSFFHLCFFKCSSFKNWILKISKTHSAFVIEI